MKEKRLTFSVIGPEKNGWKYFQHFFFTPAIATFTQNIHGLSKKWMFQRIFAFYILWWEFSIDWKYGNVDDFKY